MNSRYVGVPGALALGVLCTLPGCMQSRVDESRELHTHIEKSEAVVILPKPQVEGASSEEGFLSCVSGEMAGHGDNAIAVKSHQEFVDATFPWFEPGTAPAHPEAVEKLLTRPGVAEKIAASHVRYLVWLDGGTRKTDGGGSIACGAAPGAAGCIGFGWWEKDANYEATIWDLKQAKSAGIIDTDVTGTSAIVGAIVPLPFIARVQHTACNRMGSQLRTFFTGADDTDFPATGPKPPATKTTATKTAGAQ